ncbi:MAG: HEPN domain-containing protein [Leptospiraceae bacterium]|nr:HEPN domain-containing protein [Leptospiraceae bacterium]
MQPESHAVDQAKGWLRRANSNLLRARQPVPDGVLFEDLCFDAQQCCEKSLKALLICKGINFRYVHDLAELITNLLGAGFEVPVFIRRATILTEYAVEARYPGLSEPVTEEEYDESVSIAQSVYEWVSNQIEQQDVAFLDDRDQSAEDR